MELYCRIFENTMYIFSIALQLAAAILLVGNTDIRQDGIVHLFCQKHKAIAFRKDGTLLDRSGLEETVNSVWTNRIAFCYLVAGYLIGVFGDCTMNRWIAFITVFVLASSIFFITFNIVKRKAHSFPDICINDLPKEIGVTIMKQPNTGDENK